MFGPVLACRTFKTEEEAVAIANDSDYGTGSLSFAQLKALAPASAEILEGF